MPGNELVSVVVLCYNHSSYVTECLQSVLAQHYTNWELIVADDASTDNSKEIIEKWLELNNQIRVKTNFHTTNTGIGTMLNECIDLAEGSYLKFISADDVLHPMLLKESIDFFEQHDNDYGVVFTNARYIRSDSSLEDKYIVPLNKEIPEGWIRKDLQYSNFIPAPAVVLKKEVYDKIGKYDPNVLIDDYDCWLRASLYFKFHYINQALVYYRIHGNNISHSIDFSNDMIEMLISHDKEGDFSKGINQKIRDHYYQGNMDFKALRMFHNYNYRDKWMSFCLSKKIPYKFYRIINKLIAANNN